MDDEENRVEAPTIDVDIDELKERLALPDNTVDAILELAQRFDTINRRFGELLVYMNIIDQRVQGLAGEKQLTTTIHQHVGADGIVELSRSKPNVPDMSEIRNPQSDLAKEEPSRLAKMVVSQ